MLFNSKLAVAATLAFSTLSAIAQPIHHHNIHKRQDDDSDIDVVTVYVTAGAEAAPTPAPAAPVVAVAAPAAPPAAPAPPAVSVSVSAPAASTPAPPPSSGAFNGGAKGVVYSPYAVGACKTPEQVKSDIAKLSGFEVIRIYGVDCDQVANVLAALAPGQKVFLGIFDVTAIEAGLAAIHSAVSPYGWGVVHTISIGNELVNNGQASVGQIAGYVSTAKSVLSGLGYTGPVVSVDTFIAVINNPGLCSISDYVAVNAHAFFDSNTVAEDSGKWVLEQIQRVWSACDSVGVQKTVFVTESGWPSQGDANGLAVPSPANQAAAVSSIKSIAGDSCLLFTAFNDLWKQPGAFNAEQFWGVFTD